MVVTPNRSQEDQCLAPMDDRHSRNVGPPISRSSAHHSGRCRRSGVSASCRRSVAVRRPSPSCRPRCSSHATRRGFNPCVTGSALPAARPVRRRDAHDARRMAPPADGRTRALTMDAATLEPRCTILSLRVVSRGSAIPTAWTIIPATVKGAWRPRREGRRAHLHAVTPADGTVIVRSIAAGPSPGWFAPV
jgi:hypothetical protein